jgi:hypothetical protein
VTVLGGSDCGINWQIEKEDRACDGFFINLSSWLYLFVNQLLEIAHGLWIYWNLMVHDSMNGMLSTHCQDQVIE